nr:PREDICTED: pollen-specific leucine-rich repeat extensin-like protein 1 isoform X2 [Lepisosteus oculatus]
MPHCRAFGCSEHSGRRQNLGPGLEKVKLFAFPRDRQLAKRWVTNMGTDIGPLDRFLDEIRHDVHSNKYRLCSRHFTPEMFRRDLEAELTNTEPRLLLKAGAVPTVFPHSKQPARRGRKRKAISALEEQQASSLRAGGAEATGGSKRKRRPASRAAASLQTRKSKGKRVQKRKRRGRNTRDKTAVSVSRETLRFYADASSQMPSPLQQEPEPAEPSWLFEGVVGRTWEGAGAGVRPALDSRSSVAGSRSVPRESGVKQEGPGDQRDLELRRWPSECVKEEEEECPLGIPGLPKPEPVETAELPGSSPPAGILPVLVKTEAPDVGPALPSLKPERSSPPHARSECRLQTCPESARDTRESWSGPAERPDLGSQLPDIKEENPGWRLPLESALVPAEDRRDSRPARLLSPLSPAQAILVRLPPTGTARAPVQLLLLPALIRGVPGEQPSSASRPAMSSPGSGVSTPVLNPVPTAVSSLVSRPMSSPVPTAVSSTVPTTVCSPMLTAVSKPMSSSVSSSVPRPVSSSVSSSGLALLPVREALPAGVETAPAPGRPPQPPVLPPAPPPQ